MNYVNKTIKIVMVLVVCLTFQNYQNYLKKWKQDFDFVLAIFDFSLCDPLFYNFISKNCRNITSKARNVIPSF